MAIGVVKAIYKSKYFIFCRQKHRENGKSTGKMQGKHREFGINWSVATLIYHRRNKIIITEPDVTRHTDEKHSCL